MSSEEYFNRDIELINGKVLKISQQYVGDVGGVVWDAALVLNSYIETLDCNNKTFVELGAGTGVSGLVAAACGGSAVITDLADFIPLMNKNFEENKKSFSNSKVEILELDWKKIFENNKITTIAKNPDYILISDCIYYKRKQHLISYNITHIV